MFSEVFWVKGVHGRQIGFLNCAIAAFMVILEELRMFQGSSRTLRGSQ